MFESDDFDQVIKYTDCKTVASALLVVVFVPTLVFFLHVVCEIIFYMICFPLGVVSV